MKNYLKQFGMPTIVALSVTLSGIANAGIILNHDSTSTSSNYPTSTGASAKTTLTFSDHADGVLVDLLFENTTGQITSFGAEATASKLTGVAFDLVAPNTGVSNFSGGDHLDTQIDDASLPPFGVFDIGIADNGNFLGGNANGALAEGDTDVASFVLTGTNLTAAALESAFAAGFADGTLGFSARFQQVNAGAGSDKLDGGNCTYTDGSSCSPTTVPEPSSMALLALGLVCVGLSRRKLTCK